MNFETIFKIFLWVFSCVKVDGSESILSVKSSTSYCDVTHANAGLILVNNLRVK